MDKWSFVFPEDLKLTKEEANRILQMPDDKNVSFVSEKIVAIRNIYSKIVTD